MSDAKKQKREDPPGAPPGSGLSEEEQAEAIQKLQEVQEELEKLNEQASDEVLKVEQKYNKERKPIFDRRSKAISKLQDFWPTVFMSHAELFSALTEQDHSVFEYLRDVKVEDFPDIRSGHTISMVFAENPYFEDKVLKKTYKFSDEGMVKITGTKIRWKPGKDITKKLENGADAKKEGKKRELEEEQESFFKWFDVPEEIEIDAEAAEDEIADLIREELWPNPLRFYNPDENEEGGEEGEEEDEEGEEGGEEEGEEDVEGGEGE